MDEELLDSIDEELLDPMTEESIDLIPEEDIQLVVVDEVEDVEIEIEDSIGWVGGDNTRHYSLYGREEPNQHPIEAINGLREELDSIEALQTIYSNEKQSADYYMWDDGNVLQEDRVGYFVSLRDNDMRYITICADGNAFGVTVDSAAFIGGQDNIARDCTYGLVVHSGVANVRCEDDVAIGDYVISNAYGMAKKSDSGYGCKVIALYNPTNKYGVTIKHATIVFDVSSRQMDSIGQDVDDLESRMDDAEKNIVAAVYEANRANQDVENLKENIKDLTVSVDKNTNTIGSVVNSVDQQIEEHKKQIAEAKEISERAEKIANDAIVSAENIRDEAVKEANETLESANKNVDDIKKHLGTIKNIEGWTYTDKNNNTYTGAVAVDRILAENTQVLSSFASVKDEDGNINFSALIEKAGNNEAVLQHITSSAMGDSVTLAEIEQVASNNDASITSFVSSVDKYSVGEYSQSYGLTQEQASSILEPGYIYIPTAHKSEGSHTEKSGDWVKEFTPKNHYEWYIVETSDCEELDSEWSDSGKNITKVYYTPSDGNYHYYYNEEWGETTDPQVAGLTIKGDWREHSHTVWFSNKKPSGDTYKYWYINSKSPPKGYKSYALYIWDYKIKGKYTVVQGEWDATDKKPTRIYYCAEDTLYYYHNGTEWIGVSNPSTNATLEDKLQIEWYWRKVNVLSGNSQNRISSMIRQDVDRISLEVADARGNVATIMEHVGEDRSVIQELTRWQNESSEKLATIEQKTNDDGASIAQVVKDIGGYETDSNFKWSVNGKDTKQVYYNTTEKLYYYHNGTDWKSTDSPIKAGVKVNTASIVTAINNGDSSISLNANHITLEGLITANKTFTIDKHGYMITTGGTIGGWNIKDQLLYTTKYISDKNKTYGIAMRDGGSSMALAAYVKDGDVHTETPAHGKDWSYNFYLSYEGKLYAKNAEITGEITATKLTLEGDAVIPYTKVSGRPTKLSDLSDDLKVLKTNDVKVSSTTSGNITTTKITVGSNTYTTYTSKSSNYLLTNVGTGTAVSDQEVGSGSGYFKVSTNGLLTAHNALIYGTIYATAGEIGGWSINDAGLVKRNSNNTVQVFISSTGTQTRDYTVGSHAGKDWTIWTNSKFGVTNSGNLYATDVNISGSIAASSGEIGGWTIGSSSLRYATSSDDRYLYLGTTNSASITWNSSSKDVAMKMGSNFGVTTSGTLYATNANISGTIKANNGQIGGWTIDSTEISTTSSKASFHIASASDTSTNWIRAYDKNGNFSFGVSKNGYLYAQGATFQGTVQTGSVIQNDVSIGNLQTTKFLDRYHDNYPTDPNKAGTLWLHINRNNWIWLGHDGVSTNCDLAVGGRVWIDGVEVNTTGSDIKIKHNINLLSEKYADLFDKLQPVSFVYKPNVFGYGTSQRAHIGFIANNVEKAMHQSNISNMEFAGLVIQNPDTEDELYTLRYEEFIALNTWQIQKAKARITELEEKVAKLESLINKE